MKDFNTELKRDYEVIANPVTWGPVTAAVFFYDYRAKDNGLYPLKIRLTYKRERAYYHTGYDLTLDQWRRFNTGRGEINKARVAIHSQMAVMREHVEDLNRAGSFSFDTLNAKLGRGKKNDVFAAFEARISELKSKGRISNAVIYGCALNSLRDHVKSRELHFNRITQSWLEGYDEAMIEDGKNTTTRSMYMRCLRAIINASGAVSPFGRDKYQIRHGGGRKIALSRPQINEVLMRFDVVSGSTTDKMRDLFYFSYLTNGINIKDLVLLKWSDIRNNEIHFVRVKTARTNSTEREIVAPILPQMKRIIDKWGDKDSKYIFGYVHDQMTPQEIFIAGKNVTRLMNKHLNKITEAAGLPKISTYTARHSYASNLLKSHAPIEFISEQLGHSRITTTQAYLNGFDTEERMKYNTALTEE
jgi:integrase/recombinase XerD